MNSFKVSLMNSIEAEVISLIHVTNVLNFLDCFIILDLKENGRVASLVVVDCPGSCHGRFFR